MIEKNLESAPELRRTVNLDAGRQAIVEIGSGDEVKRIIVPYSRWKDIEEWFHDTENKSDYVFENESSGKPHTAFRISRSASEIRFTELTKFKLLSKSLQYIFLSNIPALISFVTALLLVGFVWIYSAVNSLLTHEKITLELMEPARSNTMNITMVFLLIYAIVFTFKTFRIIQDKYYALREDFEISIMSSLALNGLLVALIGLFGIEGLFGLIKSLLV